MDQYPAVGVNGCTNGSPSRPMVEEFSRRLDEAIQRERQRIAEKTEVDRRAKDMQGFMRELCEKVVLPRLRAVSERIGGEVVGPEPRRSIPALRCRCGNIAISLLPTVGWNYQAIATLGNATPPEFSAAEVDNKAFIEWLEEELLEAAVWRVKQE